MSRTKLDLTNEQYGDWHVNFEVPNTFNNTRDRFWDCTCLNCDEHFNVSQSNLRSGNTTQCKSCHNRDNIGVNVGNRDSIYYTNYMNMMARTTRKCGRDQVNYSEISVRDNLFDFTVFEKYMSEIGFFEGCHVDRIDNNDDYRIGNLQCLTTSEHATKTGYEKDPTAFSLEIANRKLLTEILNEGTMIKGRNGNVLTTYNKVVKFDMSNGRFPLLTMRKIFFNGVKGELRSFIGGAKTIEEFKDNGCNFWDAWAQDNGNLNVDYVNKLMPQLRDVIDNLKMDPHARRHVVDLWDHDNVQNDKLDLPCCHYSYIFNVDSENKIQMTWIQRSLDSAIGASSDYVLAGLLMQAISNETGYKIGSVTMLFANAHIYEEHIEDVKNALKRKMIHPQPKFNSPTNGLKIEDPESFDIDILDYKPHDAIKYLLKA